QKDGTTKFCGDYKVPKFSVRGNVWEYATGKNLSSVDPEHFEHPATFPEALCSDHVKSWSNVDDIVYDPF
ncbi:MAG: hypothetical protein GWN01_11395, partial [Nitrosopumilaceae archaeon]|nr:site-specific DNA-methyltransferase [Nitrosopumilaceae archaeon]NIU87914.1 hypothetical protein [Nitrosopumilaceae archaeon]NIV66202.1 hypothetical protein [Nitrosopumilaceae archaeon]NIX62089.1 hypothetical protein [Nitrosopumilaceae archaeon]